MEESQPVISQPPTKARKTTVTFENEDTNVKPRFLLLGNHECECSIFDLPCQVETRNWVNKHITIPVCCCCIHNFMQELIILSDSRMFMTEAAADKIQLLYLELYALWYECDQHHKSNMVESTWDAAPPNIRRLNRLCYRRFQTFLEKVERLFGQFSLRKPKHFEDKVAGLCDITLHSFKICDVFHDEYTTIKKFPKKAFSKALTKKV